MARDARFDGLFFVGIATTRIYCRPVCPSRMAYSTHRRFFTTAAAAESAGFRPCMRCRPELAPGRAEMDAVPRLARVAAHRIEAGALNGRGVDDLARELGVSERHLRRALEREVGVSPVQLAQTHRLLLAKRLLTDTALPVTRIAFASGFQSLRRFNTAFLRHYRTSPTALRRWFRPGVPGAPPAGSADDPVRLTLAYRPPLDWGALLAALTRDALPGVEVREGGSYGRTVRLDGLTGVVWALGPGEAPRAARLSSRNQLDLAVSPALLPVLMPLLSRLRQLFDLDAEPTVVDAHLAQGGLGALVRCRPGLRIPGAFHGFELALRLLLFERGRSDAGAEDVARAVVTALGDPIETGTAGLTHLAPRPERVAEAGADGLRELGVPSRRARTIAALARAVVEGKVRLEPRHDVAAARRALLAIEGVDARLATTIVMRALYWPDAFPSTDRTLQRAAGVRGARALRALAERWRPWRAYAALHLWSGGAVAGAAPGQGEALMPSFLRTKGRTNAAGGLWAVARS
jgi:AraC family transcriptional regulator of adaptative response / DNA-3-methyladenine glycosylase II